MVSAEEREQLYDIFVEPGVDLDTKVAAALELGTECLGLSLGFLTRIEQGTQEIVQSTGDHPLLQPGATCPLDEAYCRRTVEMEGSLAIASAPDAPEISETAIDRFDLGTYIGVRVVVDDDPFGTVCFGDREERATAFTEAERHFIETLARLVERGLERRAYERELAEREAELDEREEISRAVIDASFDLVFRVDAAGRFDFVSAPVEELLGYPPDWYTSQPFTTMLPDEETTELATDLYERVLSGETVEEEYFPLQSRNGDRVLVDIRVTPLYRSEVPPPERTPADIVGVQGTARKATERLRRERLIRVLNRVLRHNLRNDVTVINGFAELLGEGASGEDAHAIERIVETTDRLMSLAESARTLEQNLESPPDVEPIDVVPVVERAATQVDARYPDAAVSVETPDSALALGAPRLETAVWELVDNAAKHAGDQPSVTIEVTTGERVGIRVADDGPGLPDIERSVLATGEETPLVHGRGLGLWLVYWIVETLDGTLDVRVADGTRIEIRLPRATASGGTDDRPTG